MKYGEKMRLENNSYMDQTIYSELLVDLDTENIDELKESLMKL